MDKNKDLKTTDTKAVTKADEPVKTETAATAKKASTTAAKAETKAAAKETKEEAKTTAKKTTAKTTAKKTAAKTTAKKTTAKATTTKKAAAKKEEITTSVAVQFSGKEIFTSNLIDEVKKAWVEQFEGKLSDIKTIELYIKPEEMRAYFVVNGLSNGNYFINL